ncbi:glycosyltransferase family 61 protein [Halomonas sp. CKK8]|uniref:glycosyltransferase family 61 protein n=1 Tax=Halomonas sp. CKK8 TaxID=3036127 RepID=UPI0024150FA2|nr:glycosyltransferase family 61 protein [Halomonas sp. CKK8]WFM69996.1 glycosyltransferase family 61 protein [Halomonas sp. CKK8]
MSKEIFNRPWPEEFEPALEIHSNVSATSLGAVFSGLYPLHKTIYAYPYSRIKGLVIAYASRMKSRPEKLSMGRMPAFVHSQWSRGYFHWVTESLPRAIAVRDQFPDALVLLPSSYNSFHPESLKALGVNFDYFPSHNVKSSSALITTCPAHYGTTSSNILGRVRQEVRGEAKPNLNYGERVYISRKKSRGRCVINEEQVVQSLRDLGFVELVPEDFTFHEQVEIFRNVRFLVSIHGAGLTNMVFMNPGALILELLPFRNGFFDLRPNSLSFKHDNCYLQLSHKMGHRYSFIQCKHDKLKNGKTNLANIVVDCGVLHKKIENLLI